MTATLKPKDRQQLLDRFLRYVKVDTRSDESSESSPTTEKQKDLSKILAEELKALGCDDAAMNEWGYVLASIPSNLPTTTRLPARSPPWPSWPTSTPFRTSGKDVKPQIHRELPGRGHPAPTPSR